MGATHPLHEGHAREGQCSGVAERQGRQGLKIRVVIKKDDVWPGSSVGRAAD